MPGTAAAGEGRSSQPQSFSKDYAIFLRCSTAKPFMSFSTVVEKCLTSLAKRISCCAADILYQFQSFFMTKENVLFTETISKEQHLIYLFFGSHYISAEQHFMDTNDMHDTMTPDSMV